MARLTILGFLLFGLAHGTIAAPAVGGYSVIDLGVLPGGNESAALGLNNRGEVVGWSEAGPETVDLYTTTKGVVKGRARHAFLWKNGVMHDLGVLPGYDSSTAVAINREGSILGKVFNIYSRSQADFSHSELKPPSAALFAQNKITLLHPDGMDAVGINDQGVVVGLAGGLHACLWEKGQFRTLSEGWSRAWGINNQSQVVGLSHEEQMKYRNDGYGHAVLWQDGREYALNDLLPPGSGWVLNEAHAINDRGQIAGFGEHNGQQRAFLLLPQHEEREN